MNDNDFGGSWLPLHNLTAEAEAKRKEEEIKRKFDQEVQAGREKEAAEILTQARAMAAAEADAQVKAEAEAKAKLEQEAQAQAEAQAAVEAAEKAAASAEEARANADEEMRRQCEAEAEATAKVAAVHVPEARNSRDHSRYSTLNAKTFGKVKALRTVKRIETMGNESSVAARRWRKAIRAVIKMNKKKGNMMGVLKSRAAKGMSIVERIKRLEDRIYDELVRLQEAMKQNKLEDHEDRLRVRMFQQDIDALSKKLLTDYSTRAEVVDMVGGLKADIIRTVDQLQTQEEPSAKGEDEAVESLKASQKSLLDARIKLLADSLGQAAKDAATLVRNIGREDTSEGKTPVEWLTVDWMLRGHRRGLHHLQSKSAVYRQELDNLTTEFRAADDQSDPHLTGDLENESDLHVAGDLENASSSLRALEQSIEAGLLAFGDFDDKLTTGWSEVNDSALSVESSNRVTQQIGNLQQLLEASATDLQALKLASERGLREARVTIDKRMNTLGDEVKSIGGREAILEKKIEGLEGQSASGQRLDSLEGLVKEFVGVYVERHSGGGGIQGLEKLDIKLRGIAERIKNELSSSADDTGVTHLLKDQAFKDDLRFNEDEQTLHQLETLLSSMLKDLDGLRGLVGKDIARAQTELERR